jgi:hypothetical protein
MEGGGPASPVDSLLGVLGRKSMPGNRSSGNMPADTQALLEYYNAAQGRITEGMSPRDAANTNAYLMSQQMDYGLPTTVQAMYGTERRQMNPGGPTMTPGQLPDFIKQYLSQQGNMSLASSGGQAAGQFITGMSDTANDPTAKYGVGEGLGAAVSGAFNPLAMSLGPLGMVAGAGIGLAKSHFEHTREKNEFLEEQERLKDERIISNEANANDMSRQVLSTYNQQGVGGGYYARHGGPVDKFYTGGPTEPPAVMPGMEQYAQYANLNPELAASVANMPQRNDRLTSYSDSQLSMNKQNAALRQEDERFQPIRDAFNDPGVMMDTAQLGLGVLQTSELPVISQVAGAANALGYGARGIYSGMKGDIPHASMYAGLSGLSVAGMIPAAGAGADAAVVAKQLQALNRTGRGAQALKTAHTAEHIAHPLATFDKGVNVGTGGNFKPSYAMKAFEQGGPVDYETEKSEVILASPNDPPIAVGQGKYNRISGNLYKGDGPSHAQGGIPTRGATESFVDNAGQPVDSPYVFSDSKDMSFNADEILSMIR